MDKEKIRKGSIFKNSKNRVRINRERLRSGREKIVKVDRRGIYSINKILKQKEGGGGREDCKIIMEERN